MKRFLTLMVAIITVIAATAQNSGIVLSYNKGKELKFYSANSLEAAIEDAEVNDTIYFGPGKYNIGYLPVSKTNADVKLITKPLTFIGSGGSSAGSRLTGGQIAISIDSSLEDSKKNVSFEGLNIDQNYIASYSDLNELKLVNVSLSSFKDYDESDSSVKGVINNLYIDRCNIDVLDLGGFLNKHVNVNNTKIQDYIAGGADRSYGVATIDHCYIEVVDGSFVGLVQHSLIYSMYADIDASFENCGYYYRSNYNSSLTECKFIDEDRLYDFDNDPSSLGNCNDGTFFGTLGGKTPYTLYPQYPTANTLNNSETGKSNSFVDYDAINKKLTITVKRLGE